MTTQGDLVDALVGLGAFANSQQVYRVMDSLADKLHLSVADSLSPENCARCLASLAKRSISGKKANKLVFVLIFYNVFINVQRSVLFFQRNNYLISFPLGC